MRGTVRRSSVIITDVPLDSSQTEDTGSSILEVLKDRIDVVSIDVRSDEKMSRTSVHDA